MRNIQKFCQNACTVLQELATLGILVAVCATFALSCGKSPGSSSAQDVAATAPLADSPLALTRITRLTPEQVSRVLKQRLDYEVGWKGADGC